MINLACEATVVKGMLRWLHTTTSLQAHGKVLLKDSSAGKQTQSTCDNKIYLVYYVSQSGFGKT
jgi:hypothetical protein